MTFLELFFFNEVVAQKHGACINTTRSGEGAGARGQAECIRELSNEYQFSWKRETKREEGRGAPAPRAEAWRESSIGDPVSPPNLYLQFTSIESDPNPDKGV